jgi:voltage-gated potassium channel
VRAPQDRQEPQPVEHGQRIGQRIVAAGIVTGNIASWLVDRRLKEGRGLTSLKGKKDHIVICGWKRDMPTVLEEILRLNPGMAPGNLVIIAPIGQETLETFKADEHFEDVHILRSDFFTHTMLDHASIKTARKALVLADWSGTHSQTEVDAKTVMCSMTIKKMAPSVYVAAELLDQKFDSYLKIAQCDEIIYPKEYSRILLANSAKNLGVAPVIYDLLNVETPARIITRAIPEALVNRTYGEATSYFHDQRHSITIGLLENTGNIMDLKRQALTQAQKNPDTRTVLKDLQGVRGLRANLPVLLPAKDYIIKPNTMAVLIESQHSTEEVAS